MEHRRAWIPMADGTRLAARLWLPDEVPAAVVLEALPYRMDDLTASYSAEYERLCREGGFAVARVDLRGTGSSEGIATDEYPPEEQADLAEVIAWLAAQEWSTGRVGMYGTSYSGFNSIQIAVERPPALGAICAIYATDDRYTDDVHYTGGALRGLDLLDYVLYMAALTVLPPVPSVFGEGWREEWVRRIEGSEPWLLRWLEEQLDGPYWRHGSLRPGYERIECPTMLVGGWADGYRNNTFRTFEALECPKRLLLGPWSHMSTATSLPGPHIDLVPELVRWFGRWLRDEQNGVEDDPPIQVFVRRSTRPEPDLAEVRGVWRSERGWPLERGRDELLRPEPPEGSDERRDPGATSGPAPGSRVPGRLPWGQPSDQREDDARSLVYEWGPFGEDVEILGHAKLAATVTSTVPVAYLSAKLCDVFPDGTSALVARGFLNLAHRESSTTPTPLEVGRPTSLEVELDATSWVFEPGHRIRLALAGVGLAEHLASSAAGRADARPGRARALASARRGRTAGSGSARLRRVHGGGHARRRACRRTASGRVGGRTRCARAGEPCGDRARIRLRRRGGRSHPGAVRGLDRRVDGRARERPGRGRPSRYVVRWPEADCATEARLELRSDAEAYHVTVEVTAEELGDGEGVVGIGRRERRFERTIPRRLQ